MPGEASTDSTHAVWTWCLATAVWLAVGFSLGWYYTFTYYGRAGWPMPVPEPCAAIILYYFSVLNVPTEIQAVHWMLVFPIAGFLWSLCLVHVGRRIGVEARTARLPVAGFALAALPLALTGPWMAWLAGQTVHGFGWSRMMAVALRRGNIRPGAWLTPMYFGLGLLALLLQWRAYRRAFPSSGRRILIHVPLSMIAYIAAACVVGAVIARPLRLFLQ